MDTSIATEPVLDGASDTPVASPLRVLRENMAMERDDKIGLRLLDDALSLWWSWREADGLAPDWTAFQPFKHPRLLAHVMVYEKIGDRFWCSIVGETVGGYMPIKFAGKFIDESMPHQNMLDASMRFNHALDKQTPNFVEKTMAWHIGYDRMSYRSLQLPFNGGEGKNPRILSLMHFRVEKPQA